jgi:hypothetical protein
MRDQLQVAYTRLENSGEDEKRLYIAEVEGPKRATSLVSRLTDILALDDHRIEVFRV